MPFVSTSESLVHVDCNEQNTAAETTQVAGTPVVEEQVYSAKVGNHYHALMTTPASASSGRCVSQADIGASDTMDIGATFDLVFGTDSVANMTAAATSDNNNSIGSQINAACGADVHGVESATHHLRLDPTVFPHLPQSPQPGLDTSVQQQSPSSGVSTNAFPLVPFSQNRALRRHTQPVPKQSTSLYRRSNSSTVLTRVHPYASSNTVTSAAPTLSRRSNSSTTLHTGTQQQRSMNKTKMVVIPSVNHDGSIKRCTNCKQTDTPSWRRHPETQDLLCNACGLYLRLHRKCRPIAFDDDGNVQVIRKNAAIRREPVNLDSQMHLGGYQMQFSPLPLALMPGYQQQQQQQREPVQFTHQPVGEIQAVTEPFSSLSLETSSTLVNGGGSAMSVGVLQISDMFANELDVRGLQVQHGTGVLQPQTLHTQSSPTAFVDWYSHGYGHSRGQSLGHVHQVPLALTNGAMTPELHINSNDESSVSLTPESKPSSTFSSI
ncbi:hypothetical protein FB645_000981 [Coemansia sp. IMI 203386]|nr:hypothetical protein FB645_000981 [Coemansia sp. IMI 203386]